MSPDFNKNTVETLARRAAYKCSNPDCRINTVGPNSDPNKAITVGEAAHIYGAREGAKRFKTTMSVGARAEITNAIWLCRNCHKLIDTDEKKYSSELLFAWREQHEKYILSELGNRSDKIELEQIEHKLKVFKDSPPIIRRIVIDKPLGWEWRLTAELMRHFNTPLFRRMEDLKKGAYIRQLTHISDSEVSGWVNQRIAEMSVIINPAKVLIAQLNESWGRLGEDGNADEIYHVCSLFRDYIEQVIIYEEKIYFVNVAEKYEKLVSLLKDLVGSQTLKLAQTPNKLDGVISMIETDHGGTKENPHIIHEVITFELPPEWERQYTKELKKLSRTNNDVFETSNGCFGILMSIILAVIFLSLFV